MKPSIVLVLAVLAAADLGCGHAEQQRQAREYERFLKDSLGTVEADAAQRAAADHGAGRSAAN
jgi:hypothetical protein